MFKNQLNQFFSVSAVQSLKQVINEEFNKWKTKKKPC